MIRKVISIRQSTTEVVDPQLKTEWAFASKFWEQIAKHVDTLLNQISSPTDFMNTLDSILVLAMKEPLGIKNKSVLATFYSPDNTAKSTLESLANILLETSLAQHNPSVKDMPLWKMVLAMKVNILGIRLSNPILLQILSSPQTHTTQALDDSCPASKDLRTKLIEKQSGHFSVYDSITWQSCINSLNQLDLFFAQIPDTEKPAFQDQLTQIKVKIENKFCSIGIQNDLEELHTTVIGWLPHSDWPTLAQNHTTLIAKTEAQRILTRIGIQQETEGGFNVHDILEVIRFIAQTRGLTPTPDPYVPANRDSIQRAIRQQKLEFNDPLDLAILIHELHTLPGSPSLILQSLSQLQNEPAILETFDTQILTQLRDPLGVFIITSFAYDPDKLIKAIHSFPENPLDRTLKKTFFLSNLAALGHAIAFQSLIEDRTIPSSTIDWLNPIPTDDCKRNWIHVALLGGSLPILNTIWDKMSQQEGSSHTTLPQLFWSQEPHSLLHHAAASKDHTSLQFVLEKLTEQQRDRDPSLITDWLQHYASDGHTPLLEAVENGNVEGAHLLLQTYQIYQVASSLEDNTGIFKRTNDNQTILHLAVDSGRPEMLRLIFDYFDSIDLSVREKKNYIEVKTSAGLTCLDMAIRSGDTRLIEPLFEIKLHENSTIDKLKILNKAWRLPLDLIKLLPELFLENTLTIRYLSTSPYIAFTAPSVIKIMKNATTCTKWHIKTDLNNLTVEQVRSLADNLPVREIDLCDSNIHANILIALMVKLKAATTWNLSQINLRTLTVEDVKTLPDNLQVTDIQLPKITIRPSVRIALLGKLKMVKTWQLASIDLCSLSLNDVQHLPDDLQVVEIQLRGAWITPQVHIALLAKLKSIKEWYLPDFNLLGLSLDDVRNLPDNLLVTDIQLPQTKIKPSVRIELLGKLKLVKTWHLSNIDLSHLTLENVHHLPDNFQVTDIQLPKTTINHLVCIVLLGKLKSVKRWELSNIDLSSLTVDDVQRLPDDLQVTYIDLSNTSIHPKVLLALSDKLKSLEDWNINRMGMLENSSKKRSGCEIS